MLHLKDKDIQSIREELYLGKGYVVFRGVVPMEIVNHLQCFWKNEKKWGIQNHFNKYLDIRYQGLDISLKNKKQLIHHNFFWNNPREETTYSLAWELQAFRNRIEGQPIDWGYLPHYYTPGEQKHLRYVSSYRIACTSQDVSVPIHSDWDLDHSKIQISVMLSSYGRDYVEGGMLINDQFRGGEAVNISQKENLQAGDVLLFRYAHTHGVAPVQSTLNGKGYDRMLMPIEVVDLREKSIWYKWKKEFKVFQLRFQSKLNGRKPEYAKLLSPKKRLVRGQGEDLYYDHEIAQMMAIAIREGLSPTHVYLYRGLWGRFRMFQDWQTKILQENGLRPEHHFLDVGCGILRLGMPLIQFLDSDRYCGIDAVEDYIKVAKVYLNELVKTEKVYHLLTDRNFGFDSFGRHFDFAMAQSVFTHLSFIQIEQCFGELKKVMKPGGKFLFTMIFNKDTELDMLYIDNLPITKSSHSGIEFYNRLAKTYEFNITFQMSTAHPTQQVALATF
ncbi:MAG: ubiquinone/menaquinone biosynthesis C-methylase UbiE [Saprospiraceae bacterium]|jgi:ubiquinone/menaquinone biosynthesis C-methylase UbiE